MIFISAGHHNNDAGAVANGYREADVAKQLRNKVAKALINMEQNFIVDYDSESLGEYLARIKTGTGSVVLELHLDAAADPKATGTTALVADQASQLSQQFAKELTDATSCILNIKNRGVKPESYSARGRLGLMRENGIVALLEVCFITNKDDMKRLMTPALMDALCLMYARILVKYDELIK